MMRNSNTAVVIRFTLIMALILSNMLPSLSLGFSSGQKAPLEKARPIWEATIAAKGGRERLHAIKSLYVAVHYGDGGHSHELYVFPDRRFTFLYWPHQETNVVHIYNGSRNISWWQNNNFPAKQGKLNDDDPYQNLLAQFIYLLVTPGIEPVPLSTRKAWLGTSRVDVVEVDSQGWRVDYYIDPKTHLPIKMVLPFGPKSRADREMDHEIILDDYKEVDGVMMPHKLIHSFKFNAPKRTDQLAFEINPKFNEKIFEQPPTVKTGPESWRIKDTVGSLSQPK